VTRLEPDYLRTLPSVISSQRDRDAIVIYAERPEEVVRRLLLEDESLRDLEVSAAPLEDAFPRPDGKQCSPRLTPSDPAARSCIEP